MLALGPSHWLGLGLLLAVLGFAAHYQHVKKERAALQQQLVVATEALATERRNTKVIQEASDGYQKELAALAASRTAAASRAVRLCVEPPRSAVPVPPAGSGLDGPAPAPGGDAAAAGPDIGPRLYGLADRCDELAAQVRGLQVFVRGAANAR
jgi:hypothetical protein